MSFSCLMRMGSVGEREVRAWDSWRREPQIPGCLIRLGLLSSGNIGAKVGDELDGTFSYGCILCSHWGFGSYTSGRWRRRGGLSRFCRW